MSAFQGSFEAHQSAEKYVVLNVRIAGACLTK